MELFSIVAPEESDAAHECILATQLAILAGLDLYAQVVDIPVGDLGSSAARKFDIEAWMSGQAACRKLTSCSDMTDYEAWRLRIRLRVVGGDNIPVHRPNGTALAEQRTIIALVEQHQRPDGSAAVPAAFVR